MDAAIVGIGHTEYSKGSGRSPLQLALEASRAAIDGSLGKAGTVEGRGTGVATEAAAGEAPEDGAGVTAGVATGGTAETDKCGCESVLPPRDAVGASARSTDGVKASEPGCSRPAPNCSTV